MITLQPNPDVITVIHVYYVSPENQQAVSDGLIEAINQFGTQMAGHLSSSVHKSIDGGCVTSYSQWDKEGSKPLFSNKEVFDKTNASFAPYVQLAIRQEAHLYEVVSSYIPPHQSL
ncbi:MAG: antibiotic biosynthesis monooxygenase [Armatimonadetes bacterium]|nr:antibiotic biosynthesis monooxygenase [Armatimonadota bacterium]